MAGKFYAEGMAVRFSNGKPCCVTSGSTHLDAGEDGYVNSRAKREAMAVVIAKALTQYFDSRKSEQQPEATRKCPHK